VSTDVSMIGGSTTSFRVSARCTVSHGNCEKLAAAFHTPGFHGLPPPLLAIGGLGTFTEL
jgi:hypothetical protein